ncbi:uncharacterized protein M6B38_313575 [Iris pallida]|uniref:Myb-like domain-containing protein n=1 Tax=Iris pallida TaxID=29817 RepID=A0AAX6HH21_IRIPA|nr:uncharacterized protein M6B38_313575 [Iris pallida]
MVFKHNKQPFGGDDAFQLSYKHTTQMDYGGPFASAYRHIPENEAIPDRVWPGVDFKFEKMSAVSPNHTSLGNNADMLTISSDGGSARLESSKRPTNDGQSYQPGCKRTRQLDTDKPPSRSNCEQSCISVTDGEEFKSRKEHAVPEDSTKNLHGSIYSFPWFTFNTHEDTRLQAPFRLSSFPGYYEDHHRAAGSNQLEETQSPVFDYPPRKLVSLGQNHQADVPVWRPRNRNCIPGGSDSHDASTSFGEFLIDEDNTDKWTEFCVIPMPDSSSLASDGLVGHGKIDCCCLDEGSIRCVKKHVSEAREKLRTTLGHERFIELGFLNMGEDVALRWTEEEEQVFHEIVLSNPASLGKNFWDVLPYAFPSHTSKKFVSYYFNVFMLRKRAEQNRSDPMNVDSDNDEWQEHDDGEFGSTEEDDDEDSGVESPADEVTQNIGGSGSVDIHEEAEAEDRDEEGCGVSNGFTGDIKSKSGDVQPFDNDFQDGPGEKQDVNDDSCTSYEDQQNGAEPGGRAAALEGTHGSLLEEHGNLHAEYRNNGSDHGYMVGHCDPSPWDTGYIRGTEDIDFLPTCNVIEEVFGHESWDKEKGAHGIS